MKEFLTLVKDLFFSVLIHVSSRFANVILFVLIGRLLGPDSAGVISLATTYLTICITITRGLDDLIMRQVARRPNLSGLYFSHFLLLRVALSFALYGLLTLAVMLVFDYPPHVVRTLLILCLSILPDSITYMVQAIFLGHGRFGLPTFIVSSFSLLKVLVGYVLIVQSKGSINNIAWLWPIISLSTAFTILIVLFKDLMRNSQYIGVRPRFESLVDGDATALLFLLITVILALESQSDTIFLSVFASITELGWYGAASTITFSLTMLSQAYRMAIYPVMTRYAWHSPEKLMGIYERSLYYMGGIVFPLVGGLVVLAPKIVLAVFDMNFQPAVDILRVLSITLIFVFLNVSTSRMMLVQDKQAWSVVFLFAGFVLNVALNILFDPHLGALGAAIARVCSLGAYFLLNYIYVRRFLCETRIIRKLYKPVVASVVMAIVVQFIYSWPLAASISAGVVVYVVTFYLMGGILPEDMALIRQSLSRDLIV